MPALGLDLSELLDNDGSLDEAAERIAQVPALVSEVRSALPALKHAALAKSGEEGVRRVLSRRFAMYPQPQRNEEEWACWWADYYDVLADVALASLEAAMRAYVAMPDSEFMPKPGRLKELAFLTPCKSLSRYMRATKALAIADAPKPEERQRVGAGDVKAMLAEYQAKAIPSEAQKPKLPSIAGKPDAGGITPEMRAVLARQRGEA